MSTVDIGRFEIVLLDDLLDEDDCYDYDGIVGRRVVWQGHEEPRIGIVEPPLTGPADTDIYPIARFAKGTWGRLDERILLLEESPDDMDVCAECRGDLSDGEGYDGLCGDCADVAERKGRWA